MTEAVQQTVNDLYETKITRDQHWARLKKSRREFPSPVGWIEWLETQHGLRIHLSDSSMISDRYTVLDEQKYLMYLLKFG